jgi:ParB/RepB/Spo0J family partition protein
MNLPEAVRLELFHSLFHVEGAGARWRTARKEGRSDGELRKMIGEEYGLQGGSGGPGRPGHAYKGRANPAFYFGKTSALGKPTLQGAGLVAAVRHVLNIPHPKEKASMKNKEAHSPKPSPAPTAAVSVARSAVVPISAIVVKSNFRKRFDEKKLAELADNIGQVGVLEPLLVRQENPRSTAAPAAQRYLLIAGERRLRAAREAGLSEVPVRVLVADDQQAAEIQAFENLHRQDLSPIEEAQAFKTLLDQGGYDAKSLADRVDKSESYVHRSLKLLDLPEKIKDAIADGRLTPAHGRILLRAAPKQREEFAKWLLNVVKGRGEPPSARELWDQMEMKIGRDLKAAPFRKDIPYAGQVACAGCPFNSGNQADLFDGAQGGRCTNPSCYDAKAAQGVADIKAEAGERYKAFKFAGSYASEYDLTGYAGKLRGWEILEPGMLSSKKVKEAMSKTPDNFVWALIAPTFHGKPRAVVVAKSAEASRASGPGGGMTPAEKKERAAAKRKNFIDKHVNNALARAGLATVDTFSREHLAAIVAKMPYMNKDTRTGLEKFMTIPPQDEADELAKLEEHHLRKLAFGQAMWGWGGPDDDVLALVGVNVKKIRAEATKDAAAIYDSSGKNGKARPEKEKADHADAETEPDDEDQETDEDL